MGLALSALLTGCGATTSVGESGATSSSSSSADPELLEELARLPGVVDVTTSGDSGVGSSTTVVMGATATQDEVVAAGIAAGDEAAERQWQGEIILARENLKPFDVEQDISLPAPWSLPVFPLPTESVEDTLRDLVAIEAMGGTAGAGITNGWPSVGIERIEDFPALFEQISGTAVFADGGDYFLINNDHLRIVHVPKRTTDAAVLEIIAIATEYPNAEVLLQAPTAGPQWPMLYIARLTTEEASALDARLRDPKLATADQEGYPVEYALTATGEQGAVYTAGTLGNVPKG